MNNTNNPTNIVISASDQTAAAFRSATEGLKSLGASGNDARQQLAQSGAAFLQALERQAEAIGKSRTEIAAFRAQQLGVADAAAPMIAKLQAADKTVTKLGVSAGQTAAAFRSLPAQFTDIATQLAGGQSPFLILLQQGGQIKDQFGGIGPAFRALTSLVTPLRVAMAGLAGAVSAVGLAYYEGGKEAQAYNKALILTGGYAGASASQLTDMAAAIGKGTGNTVLAADALAQLAGSGKIAAGQMQNIAAAAVAMSRATGESIDDIVKDFIKLAEEPTKASAKLNEQFHYLTAAVYEQIAALEEVGRKNEAAALAENTYANAMKDRAASVVQNLGLLQRAWQALATDARKAWDEMLNIGRKQSTNEAIADLQSRLDAKLKQGPLNESVRGSYDKGVQNLRDQLSVLQSTNIEERKFAAARADYLQTQEASIKAQDRIKKQIEDSATKQEKMNKALAEAKRDFDAIRKADPNSALLKKEADTYANIREKFKEAKGAAPKAFHDDAATKLIEQLREQNAAIQEQLATTEKLTGADAERARFNQQITDLKTKGQLTADQKSLLAKESEIRALLDIKVALSEQVQFEEKIAALNKQAIEDSRQLARTFQGINISMESSSESRREQYERTLSTAGLSSRSRAEVEAQRGIDLEMQHNLRQATKAAAERGLLGSKDYADEVANIKAAAGEMRKDLEDFYARDKANRENWVLGAKAAFANYADEASDAARHTEEAFGNALKGLEDQLVNLFTGKKFDMHALFASTAADLTRNFVKENLTGPLASYAGGLLGDGGALAGLVGGGKGSAASRGSSPGNPLYVQFANAAGAILGGGGTGSGGGSGWMSAFGSLLGKNTGALTTAANALPGDSLDNLFALTNNFASFAVGTDYVPRDMVARIHKGEAIVRAADNHPNKDSGPAPMYFNFTVSGNVDRRTQMQIAQQAGAAVAAARRND